MAALEELKKKKIMDGLRSPASEEESASEDSSEPSEESESPIITQPLKMPDMSIAPQAQQIKLPAKAEPPAEEATSSKLDTQTARTIGRMATGATPALFSFLFGPQAAVHGMAQSQAQFAAGKPGKLVPIVGPDGSAVYETAEGAIGEKMYQKPVKGVAAKSVTFLNPSTNKVEKGSYINGQYFTASGDLVKDAQEFIKPEFVKAEGPGGETIFQAVNPMTGEKLGKPVQIAAGEAQLRNQGTQEYKTGLELSKEFPKEALPYLQKASEANPILTSLQSKNPDEVRKGVDLAANYLTKSAREMSLNINTDPGLFKQVSEMAQKIKNGEIAVNEVNAVASMVKNVARSQIDTIGALKQATATAAGPNASGFVGKRLFSPNQEPQTNVPVSASEHPEYDAAIEWANAHPTDPRAIKIKQRLGR